MSELDFDTIVACGILRMPIWDTTNQRIATHYDVKTKQNIQDISDININMYKLEINSIDDFRTQVINEIPDFNIKDSKKFKESINKAIETKKVIEYFANKTIEFSNMIELFTKDYNEYIFDKYDDITFQLKQYISNINKKSNQFVKLNKEAIFKVLDEVIENEKNKLKENKKLANKKYYENRRNELGIEKKQPLTEEEKEEIINKMKENKKLANKKYYENRRNELGIEKKQPLTEEEKEEKKKLANKKYYEKQKEQKEPKVKEIKVKDIIEETEEQMKRKKYNETYYNKQKEMRNKIKELESKLAELTK